jgi:choline kinase
VKRGNTMPVQDIKKAVILAAGLGSRLKPLTDTAPKCLTEVNGIILLEHTLDILEKNGIDEAAVVVGYLGDFIIDRIGRKSGKMKVTYIWNEIYDKTNTMYSTWLASGYLEQGAMLIEGDTIFEEALVRDVLREHPGRACWVGDRFTPLFDGSMSTTDNENRIIELKIVREKLKEYRSNYYKSTGVLKITSGYGQALSRWLDEDVSRGDVKIYYDIVIGRHLADAPIYIHDFTGGKWVEIDDINDLRRAEELF